MKEKIFTLSSLIVFIIICFISLINSKETTKLAYNSEDKYYYSFYLIDVSNSNINTKNIFNYFDNINIIEIYPYNNPLYSKFINIDIYKFDNILSSKKNISNFIVLYNSKLKENALIKEIENFNMGGIKLSKIKVYASVGEIDKVKSLCNKCVVQETSEND